MKIIGGACLLAAALLLPTNASAGGSIVALKASETYRSIIHLGEPAKCSDATCEGQLAAQDAAESDSDSLALAATRVVALDSVALAAMPVEPTVPPVALDEKTASVAKDEKSGEDPEGLFSLGDLRPGNQDMMP